MFSILAKVLEKELIPVRNDFCESMNVCGDLGVSRASPGPEQLVLTEPQRWAVVTAGESSAARPPLPISASTGTPLPAVRDGGVSAAPDLGLRSDPRQVPRPQRRSAAAGSSHGSSSWGKLALGLPGATLPASSHAELSQEKGRARRLTANLCAPRADGEALLGVSPLYEGGQAGL